MDPKKPVSCPLCGRAVSPRPDRAGDGLRALGRHFERECTVRVV